MKVIILAGGLGTRLSSVIKEIPKPMAPIGKKPFLEYLLSKLDYNIIDEIVLSVGHKYEIIEQYFGDSYNSVPIKYSIENQPMGTGGAISLAIANFTKQNDNKVLILNGDTYIDFRLDLFLSSFENKKADFSLILKSMKKFDRYGSVVIDNKLKLVSFEEKKYLDEGLINCGVYLLNLEYFSKLNFNSKYSYEKEFMEKYYKTDNFTGFLTDGYFIDIGIPSDYQKAQDELKF